MSDHEIVYEVAIPIPEISDWVERFWMLANPSDKEREIVVIPDGRIDILFSFSPIEPFHITLMGLESEPTQTTLPAKSLIFAINLKLPAVEYLLDIRLSNLLNRGQQLPDNFWGIRAEDLNNFDLFCLNVSNRLKKRQPLKMDVRKRNLFEQIYASNGSLSVQELSDRIFWSSRQINRYFNQQFGLSLKAYCNILRFRASFQHIKEGKLYPEQNFYDQAHFIKEVKRLSGVIPKELSRNTNGRFIQFSTLPKL